MPYSRARTRGNVMRQYQAPTRYGRIFPPDPEWLARAAPESILEPALPIIDAHHHLWQRPDQRYLLDDFLADLNTGHNIAATVFVQCHAMYRATGREALRPVGETEFVAGIAAMSASGGYGLTRIAAGIVGFADLTLEGEVGEADDAGGDPRQAIAAACAHRGDAGDEFGLADGAQRLPSRGAVHGVALDEDGRGDVVAGVQVGEEIIQQVALVGPLPEVMVGVDDRQRGLEDRLRGGARQPFGIGRKDAAVARRCLVLAHDVSPGSCPRVRHGRRRGATSGAGGFTRPGVRALPRSDRGSAS